MTVAGGLRVLRTERKKPREGGALLGMWSLSW
jgi:hypothetical protein